MHRQFCKSERPDCKAQNNKEGQNMEQHSDQIRARITGTGNLLREIFACLCPVLGMLYAFSHAAVALYLCAGVTGGYLPSGTCVPRLVWILLYFLAALGSSYMRAGRCLFLNADKHSPASSARSTKRRGRGGCLCQWELKAPTDRSRSDCVHEQVAKRIANVRFTCYRSTLKKSGAKS